MAIYRARAPFVSPTYKRIFILKLIFPLTALWLGLKYIVNTLFGRMLGKVVMRPQTIDDLKDELITDLSSYNSDTLKCTSETIITHDGCALDTIEVNHSNQDQRPAKEKEYVIYFSGRYGCYERSMDKII